MAAGFRYDLKAGQVVEEVCRFETVYRLSGGFNLADDKLLEGSFLPVACPIYVDFKTRKAVAVKNVRVVEAVTATGTEIKIAKNSLAYVGMFLGTGTKGGEVSAINKTNPDYDVITVSATIGVALTEGQVLFEASAVGGTTVKHVANFLNYARTKVEPGATITAMGRAYEVVETKLQSPVSEKDKASLGSNFIFVYYSLNS